MKTSTGIMTMSPMPEPPGKMRRSVPRVGGPNRPIDLDDGEDLVVVGDGVVPVEGGNGDGKDLSEMDVREVEREIDRVGSNGTLHAKAALRGQLVFKLPTDSTLQAGPGVSGVGLQENVNSTKEHPIVIDEGYHSFNFDTQLGLGYLDPGKLDNSDPYHRSKDLFGDDDVKIVDSPVERAPVSKAPTMEEHGYMHRRKKAKEEAAIEQVNTFLEGYKIRGFELKAEREKIKIPDMPTGNTPRPEVSRHRTSTQASALLGVLQQEAKERDGMGSGTPHSTPELRIVRQPAPAPFPAEVETRKRLAIERSQSLRAKDEKHELVFSSSRQKAEDGKLAQERHDQGQRRLAEAHLTAQFASIAKEKRDKEQNRLRKEKETVERRSLVTGTRGLQKANIASIDRGRYGTTSRISKSEKTLDAVGLRIAAEWAGYELAKKVKEEAAAELKQEADRVASLQRRRANEAARLAERKRAEERKMSKATLGGKVKSEQNSSDDTTKPMSRQNLSAGSASANVRNQQLKIIAEQSGGVNEQALLRASGGKERRQNTLPSVNTDAELTVTSLQPPKHPSLELQIQQVEGHSQAAVSQKKLLELKAKVREVTAENSALKRRSEEDGGEVHKRACLTEQGSNTERSKVSQPHTPYVDDEANIDMTEKQIHTMPPFRTAEERKERKKVTDRLWRERKKAEDERDFLEEQQREQSRAMEGYAGGDSYDGGKEQQLGFQALLAPNSTTNHHSKPQNSNVGKGTVHQWRKMEKEAAEEQKMSEVKAALNRFTQRGQTSQNCNAGPIDPGASDTTGDPIQHESEDSASSDEDEDDTSQVLGTGPMLSSSSAHYQPPAPTDAGPFKPRSTYGRKTVPGQKQDEVSKEDASSNRNSDGQAPGNKVIWGYYVIIKEWLLVDPESVEVFRDGPYWSLDQANYIANSEITKIVAMQARRSVWAQDWIMTNDALGMQTNSVTISGRTISADVERELLQPNRAYGPIPEKGWLPCKTFVALEKVSSNAASGDFAPEDVSVKILGSFTLLDRANKAASDRMLHHQTKHLSENERNELLKAEMKMKARRHLEELDFESEAFSESCTLSDDTEVTTWVEETDVEGPRN